SSWRCRDYWHGCRRKIRTGWLYHPSQFVFAHRLSLHIRAPAVRRGRRLLRHHAAREHSDIAASVYAVVADKKEGFAKDGKFDLEGFKNVLELRAEYEGGRLTTPEQYLDLSYYQRALTGLWFHRF